jgi:transposase-like protein
MGMASIRNWRLEVERVHIKGKPRYLWKAVDDVGEVLDIYATEGLDEASARQFFERHCQRDG